MTTVELYNQAIKPLPPDERLRMARLILGDLAPDATPQPETGYDYLKGILPQIERISLTDEDLAKIKLNGPLPE